MKKKGKLCHPYNGWQKLFQIMRLIMILFLAGMMQVTASVYSQNTKLSFEARNQRIVDVLQIIEDQSDFNFFYKNEQIDENRRISIDVNNKTVEEILNTIFKDSNVSYKFFSDKLILLSSDELRDTANSISRQSKKIRGKVIDSSAQPLPGVTVVITGTSNGTITDFEGKFIIPDVPANATLTFSFVGMKTQEIPVAGESEINVTMEEESIGLEEVIAIGYGVQKKTDVTGSVTSVKSEDLEKAVFNTVDQLLQGRASGVVVSSASGEPGAPASVRIRGNNSILGDNQPLYVVDGTPIKGYPDFNPEDVESLEVLKDASATAIYGSRGANGVILVTTKRGLSQKALLNLNVQSTLSSAISNIDVLQGQDYAEYRNEAVLAANPSAQIPYPNPSQYKGQGIDWQNEILRTSYRTKLGLSVNGGSQDSRYFISGQYLQDDGIIVNSQFIRSNLRTNIDLDFFNDKLTLQFSTNISYTKNNRAISATLGFPSSLGPVTWAVLAEPIVASKDHTGFSGEGFRFFNPYLEATEKDDKEVETSIFGSLLATWKINDNFTFRVNAATNLKNTSRGIFYPSNVASGIETSGNAQSFYGRTNDVIISNYLNYQTKINDAHDIAATIGVEYSEFNDHIYSSNVSNFDFELLGLDNLSVGTSRNSISSGRSLSVLQSGFVRLNYSYKNKFLFTATARADGSSRFAKNEKWGYFPSAALGWRVSEESFLNDNPVVSNLKLRTSYGETGSQSIAPYRSIARYGFVTYPTGNTPSTGYAPGSVENPNLKWETTAQFNLGFDLGLYENRINLTADYFSKETRDLLANVSLPGQSGFSSADINAGTIQNKGVEVNLGIDFFRGKQFKWSTNINATALKTKVLSYGGTGEFFGPGFGIFGSGHWYKAGEEFGVFYGLKATGLIQQSDLDAAAAEGVELPALNGDRQLGHWKFEDLDGNGIINGEDRQIIGNPNPDLTFGWNNDFSYKNFGLTIFIQGSLGNDLYNTLGTILHSGWQNDQSYKNQSVDWYENRWTSSNLTNDIRYPSVNNVTIPIGNFMVEDGSYVRLKNISLRYNLPSQLIRFASIQLSFTGTNLLTITNYTGLDPEVSSLGSNTLAPGVDLGVFPQSRSYTLGIKATF